MLNIFSSGGGSFPTGGLGNISIALVGDSTMRGAEEDPSDYRTSVLLAAQMLGVTVTNMSYGGKKLADVISGASPFPGAWPTGYTGDIVVIGFGANEAAHSDDLTTWRANLATVCADPRVILRAPLPMDTRVFDPAVGNLETLDYAVAVREVAAAHGTPVIDAYAFTKSILNWESLLRDKLHPTDAFYARLANDLYAPILAAKASELRA